MTEKELREFYKEFSQGRLLDYCVNLHISNDQLSNDYDNCRDDYDKCRDDYDKLLNADKKKDLRIALLESLLSLREREISELRTAVSYYQLRIAGEPYAV